MGGRKKDVQAQAPGGEKAPHDGTQNLKPFQSGENWKGNRQGRIKGSLNVKTQLKRFLSMETLAQNPTLIDPATGKPPVDEQGKPIQVPMALMDQVVLALIGKCRKGDVYAINTLFDRLEGKPRQKVEVMGEDGGPLDIVNIPGSIDYTKISTGALQELYAAANAGEANSKNKTTTKAKK